eukprot:PhF_6_TR13639/c1_g1_i1/m.21865/K12823/DDX5, DBP2; ATP-dependent RNA helicase DDX5/DBP2
MDRQRNFGNNNNRGPLGHKIQPPDWSRVKLPTANWQTNLLDPVTLNRPKSEIDEHNTKHSIVTQGNKIPPPILRFDELKNILPQYIHDSFTKQGFVAPLPIQTQAWSVAITNQDLVGIAITGSGKTLAYLVPGVIHVLNQDPLGKGDGPIMLVLAPTRELAQQIQSEAKKLLDGTDIKTICLFGGSDRRAQCDELRKSGAHIAIASPGRMIDFIETKYYDAMRTTLLVIDEADRMLDMGFEPQIKMICSMLRPDRQTLMFSATWPREVQDIAQTYQKDFALISVQQQDGVGINMNVRQEILLVEDFDKLERLIQLLREREYKKCFVFVMKKMDVDNLVENLRREGFKNAWGVHGDKAQENRDRVFEQFRSCSNGLLVATDVAQRGIDVRDVDAVINFEMPPLIEDYIHRIGRTARAGAKGDAISFINPKNSRIVPDLIKILEKSGTVVSEELRSLGMGAFAGGPRRWGYRKTEDSYFSGKREREDDFGASGRRPPAERRREDSPFRRDRRDTPPRRGESPYRRTPPRHSRDYSPRRGGSPYRRDSPRRGRYESPSRRRTPPRHRDYTPPPRRGDSPPRRRGDSPQKRRGDSPPRRGDSPPKRRDDGPRRGDSP